MMNKEELASLNKHWQKFIAKFDEIDSLKVSQWQDVHILAYICKKYKEKFGRDFALSMKGAPSKSQDIVLVKKLKITLGTTNPRIIKDFIDWTVENKCKRAFTKTAFFLTAGFANEFLDTYINSKPKRSSTLPNDIQDLAKNLDVSASTYGDLAFISMAGEKISSKEDNIYIFLRNLEAMGFDLAQLKSIGD